MTPFAISLILFAAAPEKAKDASDEFFKPTAPILTFKIEADKANVESIKKDPRKYIHVSLSVKDEPTKDMGVHIKGSAGSLRNWDDKPALTFNSNKFVKGQMFHGMDKFHLNNSVQDDAYLSEIITCEIFRQAGVPAARATHGFVEINGRKLGLYVVKEGFDRTFLKRWFDNVEGNLYDGGFLKEIDQDLKLDSGPGCMNKDLKDLAAAARISDHKKRLETLDKMLDLDKFYAFWAVEAMCCDWDGYTRNRNNYRIYHDPKSDKFVFFAHGKDQMFQNVNDGLVTGWNGLIARRLWETEEGRKRYIATVKSILEKHFKLDEINKRIDEYSLRLKEPLNAMQKGLGDQYLRTVKEYKNHVKARIEYMTKEAPKMKP